MRIIASLLVHGSCWCENLPSSCAKAHKWTGLHARNHGVIRSIAKGTSVAKHQPGRSDEKAMLSAKDLKNNDGANGSAAQVPPVLGKIMCVSAQTGFLASVISAFRHRPARLLRCLRVITITARKRFSSLECGGFIRIFKAVKRNGSDSDIQRERHHSRRIVSLLTPGLGLSFSLIGLEMPAVQPHKIEA